jgi:small ligand-binding sensory domain FIST
MRFVSLISDADSSDSAVQHVITRARQTLDGKIDIVWAFLAAHHAADADSIIEKLWLQLDPQVIVGCAAEGVIAENSEIERAPGLAILAGEMPNVSLHPFHIPAKDWRQLLAAPDQLTQRFATNDSSRAVIAFGDPFTVPITELMREMDRSMPKIPLIGGMASAARGPNQNVLLKNDRLYKDGMVGVTLSGKLNVQTLVSQGCSPVGRPLVITKGHDNIIEHLGGKPALAALSEIVAELNPDQQNLINQRGLMIGRAISEYKDHFTRGDFLVRQISGADRESGAIGVGDFVRVGQTIQFHVHDAKSAHEDLELLLESAQSTPAPAAALLFDCNGRGQRLFDQPNHDVSVASAAMPTTAIAGFFAAGELGPVGGKNFIHGHTASFALLRPGE